MMSSASTPIPAHRFAEAIKSLPLANLHLKADEVRNSISHLQSSNEQLRTFADDGDLDCREAIGENLVVIQRMEERISLLKHEVEGRGYKWSESAKERYNMNGDGDNSTEEKAPHTLNGVERRSRSGRVAIRDEELARRLEERMEDHEDENSYGIHL